MMSQSVKHGADFNNPLPWHNSSVEAHTDPHDSQFNFTFMLSTCLYSSWLVLLSPPLCLSCSSAALQALKKKKRYEKQLAQIDGTLSTIEFQREALENVNTNTEVLKNMGFAAKAIKSAHENM